MDVVIRQTPIRDRATLIVLIAVTVAFSKRLGLHFLPAVDPSRANLLAVATALAAAAVHALSLRRLYPSFRVSPSEIQGVERAAGAPVYRIELAGGRTKVVRLTGGPTREGTAHQLLDALSGAALPGHGPASVTEHRGQGGTTRWIRLTRTEALRELQAITTGQAQKPPAESVPASSSTIEYRVQRNHDGVPLLPPREVLEQWERDDEYGAQQLRAADVRLGTFSDLRFLTWVTMLASLIYLGSENTDSMGVAITAWSVALLIGLIRGVLIDKRARHARTVAARLVAYHPHLKGRGMPAPWVEAAGWFPSGTLKILRAASLLLAALFLIGLIEVIGDPQAARTGIIAVIFASLVLAGILLWVRIRRIRAKGRKVVEALAGPRLHWLEHPDRVHFPESSEGAHLEEGQ